MINRIRLTTSIAQLAAAMARSGDLRYEHRDGSTDELAVINQCAAVAESWYLNRWDERLTAHLGDDVFLYDLADALVRATTREDGQLIDRHAHTVCHLAFEALTTT